MVRLSKSPTLFERLTQEKKRLEAEVTLLGPGSIRNKLLEKLRQLDVAAHITSGFRLPDCKHRDKCPKAKERPPHLAAAFIDRRDRSYIPPVSASVSSQGVCRFGEYKSSYRFLAVVLSNTISWFTNRATCFAHSKTSFRAR